MCWHKDIRRCLRSKVCRVFFAASPLSRSTSPVLPLSLSLSHSLSLSASLSLLGVLRRTSNVAVDAMLCILVVKHAATAQLNGPQCKWNAQDMARIWPVGGQSTRLREGRSIAPGSEHGESFTTNQRWATNCCWMWNGDGGGGHCVNDISPLVSSISNYHYPRRPPPPLPRPILPPLSCRWAGNSLGF